MNELKVINQQEILGKQFIMYGTAEEPLFKASDVAEWIEYSKSNTSHMVKGVDESERVRKNVTTPGGMQETWFLTEDGLYEVLMQSRKPIAKQFKKKVKEVLKDIRRHGMYATDELLNNPDFLVEVAGKLKEEHDRRVAAEQVIEEQRPKVEFADHVRTSKGTIDMDTMAKLAYGNNINIGRNRLMKWLREKGILMQDNKPYQRHIQNGHLAVTEVPVRTGFGMVMKTKPLVTGKGQLWLLNMLKEEYPSAS